MNDFSFIPFESVEKCDGCPRLCKYAIEIDPLHGLYISGCLEKQSSYEDCEFQKRANQI
jgi:hypothetical protein